MALLGIIPSSDKNLTLRMTPQEVEREGVGRALMMIGGTVSLMGGAMVLSVNPAMKKESSGLWRQMPQAIRENKALAIVGLGVLVAGVSTAALKSKMFKRYGV